MINLETILENCESLEYPQEKLLTLKKVLPKSDFSPFLVITIIKMQVIEFCLNEMKNRF